MGQIRRSRPRCRSPDNGKHPLSASSFASAKVASARMREARTSLFPLQGTAWRDGVTAGTPRFRLIPRTPISALMIWVSPAAHARSPRGRLPGAKALSDMCPGRTTVKVVSGLDMTASCGACVERTGGCFLALRRGSAASTLMQAIRGNSLSHASATDQHGVSALESGDATQQALYVLLIVVEVNAGA